MILRCYFPTEETESSEESARDPSVTIVPNKKAEGLSSLCELGLINKKVTNLPHQITKSFFFMELEKTQKRSRSSLLQRDLGATFLTLFSIWNGENAFSARTFPFWTLIGVTCKSPKHSGEFAD